MDGSLVAKDSWRLRRLPRDWRIAAIFMVLNPKKRVGTSMSPISSNAYGRLFVFFLLLLAYSIAIFGIIPMIMLIFGLVMADRKKDCGFIAFASRVIDGYAQLLFALTFLATAYFTYCYATEEYYSDDLEQAIVFGILALSALALMVAQKALFLEPLSAHNDWINGHGVFRSSVKTVRSSSNTPSRLKVRKFRTGQSVADELLKWGKLRDDGHISEAEFLEMKDQLLERR
ncbi:SHOCT domain-containing protein [Sedimentitalea sp. JM2-8]|uniref:SHOCT domain-containing protein n=2 Tax=Sedimentitalea xiamensis TaxID=3050037 RepID=A0ABT7FFZ4_9RHOB|nr:SHOCT domain-containing protein [Sedimentitalea xiamensis]